ncbi:hypothetical protein [Escherichia coli]|nr:hypothetical protein [Escherichia coli]
MVIRQELTVDTDYVLALDDNGYTVITAISGGKNYRKRRYS